MHFLIGEYDKAGPIFIQSRDLRKKIYGENHPLYVQSLSSLAVFYEAVGDYTKSETLMLLARDLYKNILGENHPSYAANLLNIAGLYKSMGEYSKAEPIYLQTIDLHKKLLGDSHPSYASSLINLAGFYNAMGAYSKAEPIYQQAIDLQKKLQRDNHPTYASSLKNFAGFYIDMKEYARAEPVLLENSRSYEMSRLARASGFQRAIGDEGENPYLPLATVSANLGKPRKGFEAMEKNLARALLDVQAQRRGQDLNPEQKERQAAIFGKLRPIESRINILITRPQLKDEEKKELDTLIDNRRRINVELADLAAELSRQEVSDFATIQRAIPSGHALIAWVDVTSRNKKTDEHWACVLKSTGEPVWVRLTGSGEMGRWTEDERNLTANLRGLLKKELLPGDTSVSDLFEKVNAQRIAPLMAHLEGIETLYVVPVNDMAGIPVEPMLPDRTICYVPSGTFLARRGQPLEGPDTILALGDPVFPKLAEPPAAPTALPPGGLLITEVVPEGEAARAKLQAGDVLVSYAGTRLESVKQLGELIAANAGKKEVACEFWREDEDKVVPRTLAPGKLGVAIDPEPARDAIAARRKSDALFASLTRGDEWTELPGTEVEVGELRKLFGGEKNGSKYLTRSEASEQALDALRKADTLKNYKFLHLATHGETNDTIAFNSRIILSQDRPKATEAAAGEPLLDNQLLAKEVMDHWKLNASLVTLSACESGLGRQGGGDGLLGFAQSFLLAGARSVCLSLWKVDDRATALLMDRFYRNMIEKKMTKVAALKEAKEWLRNLSVAEAADRLANLTDGVARADRPRRKDVVDLSAQKEKSNDPVKPFGHPKYWAAFILIGSPD